LSSAILYVAIVAIWAGVLIPRWLRRDSSGGATTAEDTPVTGEEPVPASPRAQDEEAPRRWDEETPRGWDEETPRGRDMDAPRGRDTDAPRDRLEDGGDEDYRSARDQEHAGVLTARRRLLMLLLALTAGSCLLAVSGLAAWWVLLPPTVMLLGYLALLREAAKADAERRDQARSHPTQVAAGALAPQAPPATAPAPPPAPPPAPDAEIIDISASVAHDGEELYDQYADAKLRAVGDLARPATRLTRHAQRRHTVRACGPRNEMLGWKVSRWSGARRSAG
jgi:hypothetical protein